MYNIQNIKVKKNTRLHLTSALFVLMLCLSFGVGASHPVIKSINFDGVVIDGYDAVAYFTMRNAVKGSKDISADWLGGKWLFVNDKHRDLFLADPTKYAPQFGGYCSSGTRPANHADVDPEAWHIVDNKLYLFYSTDSAAQWISDPSSLVAVEKKWGKARAGLSTQ